MQATRIQLSCSNMFAEGARAAETRREASPRDIARRNDILFCLHHGDLARTFPKAEDSLLILDYQVSVVAFFNKLTESIPSLEADDEDTGVHQAGSGYGVEVQDQ